jgi:hypothetical protein
MSKIHNVGSTKVENDSLFLEVDGKAYSIYLPACSPRLAQATSAQRQHIEVSPSGYGLHWPEIDEDLAITPLLKDAKVLETI